MSTYTFDFTEEDYTPPEGDRVFFDLGLGVHVSPSIPLDLYDILGMTQFTSSLENSMAFTQTVFTIMYELIPSYIMSWLADGTTQSIMLSLANFQTQFLPTPINEVFYISHCVPGNIGQDTLSFQHYVTSSLAFNFFSQVIIIDLPEGVTSSHFIIDVLLGDNVSYSQFIVTDIINITAQFGHFVISELIDTSTYISTTPATVEIFIDNVKVNNFLTECQITQRESDALTHCELTFKDTTWFDLLDPQTLRGQPRIKVKIGDDIWWFLLEDRSASESNHTINVWGRNPTAILADPYAETVTEVYFNRMASVIIAELAGDIPVTLYTADFFVEEFSIDGYPLDGIKSLAEVLGGVLRSNKDASLYIRSRFPVRPVNLPSEVPSKSLTRYSNILSSDYSEEQPQYNSVRIVGQGSTEPELSIETGEDEESSKNCYFPGQTAFLRVYKKPESEYVLCTNAGTLTLLESDKMETIKDEIVNIDNENGSFSKYCVEVKKWNLEGIPQKPKYYVWPDDSDDQEAIPVDPVTIIFQHKDIHIPDAASGCLKVTYTTCYDKWQLYCDQEVEVVIAALGPEFGAITYQLTAETVVERKIAPEISNDMLITDAYAIIRGTVELDDVYYRKHKWTVKVPYAGYIDGEVVRMEDDYWGLIGNSILRQADISITWANAMRVYQDLEVHQFSHP
jgi:hypothetical protein